MEELLKKIYKEIIYYEKDTLEMDKRISEALDKITEPYINNISDEEIAMLKSLLYQAALLAQTEGFYLGMRYMLKLEMCLLSKEDIHKL